MNLVKLVGKRLKKNMMKPRLRTCILRYAKSRGGRTMESIAREVCPSLLKFARSQDLSGWRGFMEGIVSKEIVPIQAS